MTASRTTPAVFLDRDGTLIEDRGHLRSPSEVVFFPDTVRALRLLQQSFKLFIVTHQPGIAEGAIEPAEAAGVHEFILGHLTQFGVRIEGVYCCPHRRSDGCRCIKPKPHYLRRAAREYGIDLRGSFVIGDHPHDVELARNAGATGIYVLTGHGARHRAGLPADALVASDLWEAAKMAVEITSLRDKSAVRGLNLRPNPAGDWPRVDATAYVDATALIVGRVEVGPRVFVGPHAVVRADEVGPDGRVAPVVLEAECNIQDGVIIHALAGTGVTAGRRASLSHGCIVHGPCELGAGCFVGFGAVVFRACVGAGAFIGARAVVQDVGLPGEVYVPPLWAVSAEGIAALRQTTPEERQFMEGVALANLRLVTGYLRLMSQGDAVEGRQA